MFGKRLRAARRLRDVTQTELSRRTGVAQSTIAGVETGAIATPNVALAWKLAHGLGLSLDDLAAEEEGAAESPPAERPEPALPETRCALREAAPLLGCVPLGRLDEHLARTVRLFASALDGCANCQYRLLGRFRWWDRGGINGARLGWAAGPAGSLVASA